MSILEELKEETKIIKLPGAFLLFILDRTTKERNGDVCYESLNINDLSNILKNLEYLRYAEGCSFDSDLKDFMDMGWIGIDNCLGFRKNKKDTLSVFITEKGRKIVCKMRLYDKSKDSEKKGIGKESAFIAEEKFQKAVEDARKAI